MELILGTKDPDIIELFRQTHYVFHPIDVEINMRKFSSINDPVEKAKEIARAKSDNLGKAFQSNDKVVIVTLHQETIPDEDYPITALSFLRPAVPPQKACRFIRIDKSSKLGQFPMTNMRQIMAVLGFQLAKAA